MNGQDFNCSITAKVTANEAIKAISEVNQWWAKNFEGASEKLNDVFTVRFGTTHVTFRVSELTPGAKVVWDVIDSYLPWLENKTEWTETKILFEVFSTGGTTTINFTHLGLNPQAECYKQCEAGWTEHVTGSLHKLLTEGVGEPA
jgi:hypothetical protein